MNSILLIHNDTVPEKLILDFQNDNIGDVIKFDITPDEFSDRKFNLDRTIHQKLKDIFSDGKQYSSLYLPYNLSKENYLDFSGLLVAFHIRLTPEFRHSRIPIVFYGPENPIHIGKLVSHGNILISPKVKCIQELSLSNFIAQSRDLKFLNDHEYFNFLEFCNLEPKNSKFSSHHSIANQYALYNWSVKIGISDQIKNVSDVLKYRLYFKWLDSIRASKKNKTTQNKSENLVEPSTNKEYSLSEGAKSCKILLIDDESNAGWGVFWKEFLAKYEFEQIEDNLKILGDSSLSMDNLSQDQIILLAENEILSFDPDVVLLDLRLDRIIDFDENSLPSNLTGIKIAQLISAKNRGTQVVITSASNKIASYLAASKDDLGVDGYIIKSIEDDADNKINHIINTLNDVIPRAKFFKAVAIKIKILKDKLKEFDNDFFNDYQIFLKRAFRLLYQNDINFSYLQLFHLIESYSKSDKVVSTQGNQYHILTSNNKNVLAAQRVSKEFRSNILYTKADGYKRASYRFGSGKDAVVKGGYIPVRLIMKLILVYRLGSFSKVVLFDKINSLRNAKCGHSPESSEDIIYEEEYHQILDFLLFIFDNANVTDLRSSYLYDPKKWKDPENVKKQSKKKQKKRY